MAGHYNFHRIILHCLLTLLDMWLDIAILGLCGKFQLIQLIVKFSYFCLLNILFHNNQFLAVTGNRASSFRDYLYFITSVCLSWFLCLFVCL